ncbi:MAG: DUF6746 family protein [Neptuniibacter sp.]
MKHLVLCIYALLISSLTFASGVHDEEKPVQHFKAADVTSLPEAKNIFFETTNSIKQKKLLDENELHEIHIITYTLEKSVAYLSEHLTDKGKTLAEDIAVVVEDIHINSENNRQEKTRQHLNKYFLLVEELTPLL